MALTISNMAANRTLFLARLANQYTTCVMTTLTVDRLRDLLDYCPTTGMFSWRYARRGVVAGSTAGVVNVALGYRQIGVDKGKYYAHRLAWFHVYGEWPKGEIDHINGVRDDNRIFNLRETTCFSQNKCNSRRRKNNLSGYKGVSLHKETGKWRARVKHHGIVTSAGLHDTPKAAHEAYKRVAAALHGEFAKFE